MKSFLARAILPGLLLLLSAAHALPAEPAPRLVQERFDDHIDCQMQNPALAEITVTFELALNNAGCSLAPPYTLVIPGGQKVKVFTVSQLEKNQPWNYAVKYKWIPGNFAAVHDSTITYRLPYPAGKSFLLEQGNHGRFSHTNEAVYAFDWKMPVGSPVCAAREGTVVGVQAGFREGGTDKAKFADRANYIQSQHSDHTIGEYVHLKPNGVLVKPGQVVKAGDRIGFSGNTGYTAGPHLHFMVFKAASGIQKQSLPIRFNTVEGSPLVPEEGKFYTAP